MTARRPFARIAPALTGPLAILLALVAGTLLATTPAAAQVPADSADDEEKNPKRGS